MEYSEMENTYQAKGYGRKVQLKEKLIAAVKSRPPLWDKRTTVHRDRGLVEVLWDEVAQTMQRPKDDCKRQWRYLMDQFRAVNAAANTKKRRSGRHEVPTIKWAFYEKLSFMQDVVQHRTQSEDNDETVVLSHCQEAASDQDAIPIIEQIISNEDILMPPETHSTPSTSQVIAQNNETHRRLPRLPSSKRHKACSKLAHETGLLKARLDFIQNEFQKTDDGCTRFCSYLEHVMRKLQPEAQRQCEILIVKLVNASIDNDTSYNFDCVDRNRIVVKNVSVQTETKVK